jgi:hypothetical protein
LSGFKNPDLGQDFCINARDTPQTKKYKKMDEGNCDFPLRNNHKQRKHKKGRMTEMAIFCSEITANNEYTTKDR